MKKAERFELLSFFAIVTLSNLTLFEFRFRVI